MAGKIKPRSLKNNNYAADLTGNFNIVSDKAVYLQRIYEICI